MDPLDDVFAAMRVHSALYARLETAAPWGVRFAAGQSARFGLVVRGGCWLTVDGRQDAIPLAAGDCYVLVRGSRYVLSDHPSSPTRDCVDVVRDKIGGVVELDGGGAPATIITGWFLFDELSARPLLNLVPTVVHVRMDHEGAASLQSTLHILATETSKNGLGSRIVVSRLADIIFVQAIRAHIASNRDDETGWLGAVSDPRIGPALRAVHGDLARQWTVESLAEIAGLSRSAFALRFREKVGQTPLEYLVRWRMFRASSMLRQTNRSIAEIAELTGYESSVSFGKAFKRITGQTPKHCRAGGGDSSPQGVQVSSDTHRKTQPPSRPAITMNREQEVFDTVQVRDAPRQRLSPSR